MHKSKLRVLLINPPQTYYSGSQGFNVYFPLGLLYLAAVCSSSCEVTIYDCLVSDYQVRHNHDGSTTYGAGDEQIKKAIRTYEPDIVGITAPFSSQRPNLLHVASLVKACSKRIFVVVGGPDATVSGEEILSSCHAVDVCVQGEGEYVLLEIIQNFWGGKLHRAGTIPGLYYRNRLNIVCPKTTMPINHLDDLPFPRYDLISFPKYLQHPFLYRNRSELAADSISVITSRGCPYHCVFCSVSLHMGRVYRPHSSMYVLNHIRFLLSRYQIHTFHFEDDNLTLNKKRFEEILDGILREHLAVRWDTPNGVRADTLDQPLLRKMQRAGCASLTIAVESGNQRVLDTIIGKRLDLSTVRRVAQWCYKIRLPLNAFFVIGFPGETQAEIRQTLAYAITLYYRYHVTPVVFIATPLYGTRLYDIVMRSAYLTRPITPESLSTGTQPHGQHLIATEDFSVKDLDRLILIYQMKKQIIEWGNYKNKYNIVTRHIKPVIQRFVYHSDTMFFLRCITFFVSMDMRVSFLVRRFKKMLKIRILYNQSHISA